MNPIEKTRNIKLTKDWVDYEEQIQISAPSFYRKIKSLKLSFIQEGLVVLIKLDLENKEIREILNLDKLSYQKCVEQTKQEMKLFNCFSLKLYLKML